MDSCEFNSLSACWQLLSYTVHYQTLSQRRFMDFYITSADDVKYAQKQVEK